jgi:glycosyltransferase involved in cell wall biosynthesis
MRVTYITRALETGGAESQLLEMLRHVDRTEFQPSLILLTDIGSERANGLVDRVYVADSRTTTGRTNTARCLINLVLALKKTKPDIVHALLPEPCILGFAAAKLCRVPVLVGSRRSLVDCYRPNHWWPVVAADRFATTISTHMTANSAAIVKELAELDNAPASKLSVIYNGIDCERFNPAVSPGLRQELGWNSSNVVFGCVANFHTYKRQIDLVRAAGELVKEFPHARFLLLGEDRGTMSEIKQEISNKQLESFFVILPGRSDPEAVYAALDVYVCTSDTEGFSNVILEAMACGKPVIATNVGGNPEAVCDDRTGIIIAPRSPETIANASRKFLASPELRVSMGQLGRERIEQQFSRNTMVKAHEDLYRRLLRQHWNR